MLVADPVFVEQLGHFFGDHVAVVRDGNQRDFFPDSGGLLGRGSHRLRLFRLVSHASSIHHSNRQKGELFKRFQ